ncbi:MAG: hypothetical protein SCABRO_01675 [Candidatus Scalindua brodae]|uniref:Uncharacterized protein n=1 Tax=Candidatus Scalindua brodae TaxID=237368 RepID=A0A0B0EJ25_9BACT|nr:MAG: hypothetical protein SCABRO_01675 [Candidatus Scalindua brodae]
MKWGPESHIPVEYPVCVSVPSNIILRLSRLHIFGKHDYSG